MTQLTGEDAGATIAERTANLLERFAAVPDIDPDAAAMLHHQAALVRAREAEHLAVRAAQREELNDALRAIASIATVDQYSTTETFPRVRHLNNRFNATIDAVARASIPEGRVRLARDSSDDPVIVESWV